MTENKRFTLEWESEEICQVADNGNYMGTDEVVDLLNELVTKCNTLTDEKSKCECQLNRRTRQRDELAEFNVELMEENKELKEQLKDCQQKKQNIKDLLMNSEPVVEQKKLQKLIYRIVINLIDRKIKDYNQQLDDEDIDDNLAYYMNVKGHIEAFKELKKELQE